MNVRERVLAALVSAGVAALILAIFLSPILCPGTAHLPAYGPHICGRTPDNQGAVCIETNPYGQTEAIYYSDEPVR